MDEAVVVTLAVGCRLDDKERVTIGNTAVSWETITATHTRERNKKKIQFYTIFYLTLHNQNTSISTCN